jgi:hypothetical protein
MRKLSEIRPCCSKSEEIAASVVSRFDVFMTVNVQAVMFYVVALCSPVGGY